MLNTTVGQLLVNEGLPEDLRDYKRVLDKKAIRRLMSDVATKHPEQYGKVLKHVMDAARSFGSAGGASVSLRHLKNSNNRNKLIEQLQAENEDDINNDQLPDDERNKRIITRSAKAYEKLQKMVMDEGLSSGSPYATQVQSGARGNPSQLASLVGGDLLVMDHKNEVLPTPIYNSYSHGLDPVEYWAASYGTRKGLIDVKFATADSGFLGKQLALAAQRQVVTNERPRATRMPVGLPVEVDDPDNEGAVLAVEAGGYPAGTVLTPRVLEDVRRKHSGRIILHSPITSLTEDGGIDQWSAGMREKGRLADIGDHVGMSAAQAISEPVSQGMLNSKHSSGVSSRKVNRGGFDFFNSLLQAPETFAEAGPLAPIDGEVTGVVEAPQGGHYIHLGDQKLYVRPGIEVTVKQGDKVEQGDDLTDGVPNPRDLVRYRGIGEARRVYLKEFMSALKNSDIPVHRRNAETIVASMINHAKVTDPDGFNDHLVDQIVPYSGLAANYRQREGTKRNKALKAVGQYLEEPVLHYTPGTRISRRVAKELQEFGLDDVDTHVDPPSYEPHFERLMTATSYDPDWRSRMAGFYIGRSLQKSVHEGAVSDSASTSPFPGLAEGTTFGDRLKVDGRF